MWASADKEGVAQHWVPAAGEIFLGGWLSPCLREWGEGSAGQPPGAGTSQVTSPPPLPWLRAFPQCPGWGWALVQALLLVPETGAAGHAPCLRPAIAPSLCQLLTWASRRQPPRSPCACPSAARSAARSPHPPRCSDLANRARRCRSEPAHSNAGPLNPFPLGLDSSPSPNLPILRDSQG